MCFIFTWSVTSYVRVSWLPTVIIHRGPDFSVPALGTGADEKERL